MEVISVIRKVVGLVVMGGTLSFSVIVDNQIAR
jgi:hypothetical protein